MIIDLLKRLKRSGWLDWIVFAAMLAIFSIPPLALLFIGENLRGLGLFAFVFSVFLGPLIGVKFAQILTTTLFNDSSDIGQRLSDTLGFLGFALLPFLVAVWTNSKLGTMIGIVSTPAHLFFVGIVAVVIFCLPRQRTDD